MTSRSHLISRLVLRGVLGIALIDVILFGVAGRLDWRAAWVMSGMFTVYVAAGTLLRDELGGYREYALNVRQRLVPGVW